MVHSKIIYAIEIYANTYVTYLHDLIILNNRVLRILQKTGRTAHVSDLYINFNTLIIPQLFKLRILLFAHAIINNSPLLPSPFHNRLTFNNQVHQHNTRQSHDPHRMSFSTNSGSRNTYNQCATLWGSLSSNIKCITSLALFENSGMSFLRLEQATSIFNPFHLFTFFLFFSFYHFYKVIQ